MKTTAQPIVLTGGVNLNKDPRVIRPDQLALAKNAFPVIPGILGKREGIAAHAVALNTGTAYGYMCLGIFRPPAITGFNYVAHLHKMHATAPTHLLVASSFNKETGSFTNSIIQSLGPYKTDYEPVKFLNYRGLCIAIVPGEEGYWVLQQQLNNTYTWVHNTFAFDPSYLLVQNSQGIAVTPRNGAQFKQRMVWGNFGPGRGSWIVMADKATATVLQPFNGISLMSLIGTDALLYNGRHIEVGAIENEEITAMQEVSLSNMGSQIDSVLMLLTNKSCVFISGEILQTDATDATDANGLFGSYKEHRINYECGCVSEKTLVKSPYGWIWASGDDVWMLQGSTPVRVGTNIRPALMNTPPTARQHWSAAYANGVYILQLVTATTVQPAGHGSDITSYMHEYWYLDMRDGPPQSSADAQWYGPMQNDNHDAVLTWMGPLLSDKTDDGLENVRALGGYPTSGVTSFVDFFGSKSGNDMILNGEITANPWQAGTQYAPGDIIRPTNTDTNAGREGRMHVCKYYALPFDTQTGNYTAGDFLVGAASAASAVIAAIVDNGTSGYLLLTGPFVGAFQDNELITDSHTGSALVNGTLGMGTSSGTEPDWSTSTGGDTNDGSLQWQEIQGTYAAGLGVYLRLRQLTEFRTDIRGRDSLLEDGTHEKLIRRVDANITAAGKMNVNVTALFDQGAESASLGDNTFGASAVEGDFDILPVQAGGVKSLARSFRPSQFALAQCRQAQIKIQEGTQYIIDDSNDTLIFMLGEYEAGNNPITGSLALQVQITQGAYTDLDSVLDSIMARLSNYAADVEAAFTTWDGVHWTYDSAYSSTFPYFTRIKLELDTPVDLLMYGVIGGPAPVEQTAGIHLGDSPTTLYFDRSRRLMALLGFAPQNNTQRGVNAYLNMLPLVWGGAISDDYNMVFAFAETGVADIYLDGGQIVQKKNSQRFDIAQATVVVQPKTAVPLVDTDRS